MMEVKTKRLVLKKPDPADKQRLVEAIGDWDVARWLATVPYPYTIEDADYWYDLIAGHKLIFSIYYERTLIGGVGLSRDSETGVYDLGYWIAREYWGFGYATEAARALLDYASKYIPDAKIGSSYMKGNEDSANVLKKIGFIETGSNEIHCLARGENIESISLRFVKNPT